MDLHTWITQRVNAVEELARDRAAADRRHPRDGVAADRDTDADRIVRNAPLAVLRRCEADRRVLARHGPDPDTMAWDACAGCGTDEWDVPHVDNINACPELLDLAHAHGITQEALAGLERPERPERPEPRPDEARSADRPVHGPAATARHATSAEPPTTSPDPHASARAA
ncbi:DUF6221 family protein [Streptomyces sp. NPDC050504]|uniref:DUF6221 family protein n=1 Tax=Streptomyces sp. NPDC050504 TaxID=3365618 RepID=UPI0037B1A7EC